MSSLPSPMGQAALQYARQGWPVFPCRESDGEPYIDRQTGKERISRAKSPYTATGVKDATTDEQTIVGWWRRWPRAMIGVAMDRNGLFAVDFDPRVEQDVDPETGEVLAERHFTLEQLKADTETLIGCEIPSSLASVTPSGGVHVFLRQPDDGGDRIRNRDNLPKHVDVRGRGGYVIVPPSTIVEPCEKATAGVYRWLRGRYDVEPVDAPGALIELLRSTKAGPAQKAAGDQPAPASSSAATRAYGSGDADASNLRKYGLSALAAEADTLAAVREGEGRNIQINKSGFRMGQLVAAGALTEAMARSTLQAVIDAMPNNGDPVGASQTLDRGLTAGQGAPRDLADVLAAARARAARSFHPSARPAPRGEPEDGKPSGWKPEPANDDDGGRGADDDEEARHRRCIFKPHTDLGNAERFAERFGDDFRWSPALGWMGWDGRRWVALKQEEKAVPPEVLDAVFRTVRAIQDEAEVIRESGATKPDWFDEWEELPEAERYKLDAFAYAQLKMWRQSGGDGNALDCIVDVKKGQAVTRADHHRKWGRSSEANGKLTCIARLAQPWLAVKDDAFDADPFTINVLNGTLRFRRRRQGDKWIAEWKLDPHDRADLISKLAPVEFDRKAACPLYDGVMSWAQEKPEMRRYLHQWGGLSMTGDMGEQKLHFWYGLGGNGKSTVMDAWCYVLGDYTTTIPIETFLDQGVKRRGDQATPELARLGGVRLLRTSEPERGAKLAAALIKLVTGGEPMSVRYLNRGFFDLRPLFKMTVQGNFRPEIPDTDDGIWRRLKLVGWSKNIDREPPNPDGSPKKDPDLPAKLQGEASGIFNRLVEGLLDWLANGLVEPEDVTKATQDYRTESDPLARFLTLCTRPEPEGRVQSSHLHALFAAWCKAAGEREWTQKGFSKAMLDKGFEKKASDGMQWLGIVMTRHVDDFVDPQTGAAKPFTIDDAERGQPPPRPHGGSVDDDLPPL